MSACLEHSTTLTQRDTSRCKDHGAIEWREIQSMRSGVEGFRGSSYRWLMNPWASRSASGARDSSDLGDVASQHVLSDACDRSLVHIWPHTPSNWFPPATCCEVRASVISE